MRSLMKILLDKRIHAYVYVIVELSHGGLLREGNLAAGGIQAVTQFS